MSIMVGVGRGAALGVLIKNAEALERDGEGRHPRRRQDRHPHRGPALGHPRRPRRRARTRTRSSAWPPAVERASEHPLGRGHRRAAADAGLGVPDVTDFDAPTGKGVTGTVEGRRVLVGSADFLTGKGVDTAASTPRPTGCAPTGPPPSSSASTAASPAILAIADPVKDTTAAALRGAARRRHRGRHAHRRQPGHRRGRRPPPGHRPRRGRGAPRPQERRRQAAPRARAASSPWPATASTTHPPWPPPTSASP